jgi:hypothetical protein
MLLGFGVVTSINEGLVVPHLLNIVGSSILEIGISFLLIEHL